ncbi:MAG: 23S rRNA (uracil(1939)-C(5))-methyltransferase RlmD [SAR202 cluster bacterium]|jgi:23S rRNA (uracil1939-C5)-methyltransferase|nr:23S rRNA (uracil(1939)-C(5))-methyltransferase RlmD [SAR202 cluster bacterium]HAL49159.1 23S rRNA (uracil(1939)-C(5))-methyltransferase RlmD [Dehalococcoidia bacterium]MDP6663866.1 23S rRNA (uracil(1939)-C(5))-methyltransferase RlmD [SAR202 cluster bacterium]MDP6799641.1 23S rRNA (uracil(1939)-C(5))-methyltransferase RlmD [SAR202 cluster bacterium]MQG57638.1 23S rRNA (uracil(1939)-C(5))-methyltransferase RlmD [SAR202 cluster bacterium]|tara:strand:- start:19 stop:1260 length:1242 start_codon:yes stop_codon:yes gene_type:complete
MTLAPNKATPDRETETAELELLEMGELGDTVAEFEDQQINVFGGIPGERVVARIYRYRRRKKKIVSAMVDTVLRASSSRVAPPCPYYGPCSGCQWQHISYDAQLELKREAVARSLRSYPALSGADVSPTRSGPSRFNYRNHARFTVRYGGQLGFSNRITRRFVRVDRCMLMGESINEALTALQDRCGETTNLSIRIGANTGNRLIQPTFKNPEIEVASGQTHYVERLHGWPFRVASPSFFQVNTAQAESLIDLVRERLELTGSETVVDAYAGVGVFAVLLAPHVTRAIAIEDSHSAIEDAKINAADLDNLTFVEARAEDAMRTIVHEYGLGGPPDAVVLDPPRVGCHPGTLEALLELRPRHVAYVSCDPPSLARDLDILVKGGYSLDSVDPVDMFPQTYHVECLATLSAGADR